MLENFQRQLELSDDSLVKTIVLFGLESILNTKSSSIDIESASLLDILYLISDNSSPYHNVNIFILLKRSTSGVAELDIEDVLRTGFNRYSSMKFNARSFIGRITAITSEPVSGLLYSDTIQSEDILKLMCTSTNEVSIHRNYGVIIFILIFGASLLNMIMLFWCSPSNRSKFKESAEVAVSSPFILPHSKLSDTTFDAINELCVEAVIERKETQPHGENFRKKPCASSEIKIIKSKLLRNRKLMSNEKT